jgi:methionyl aminopeptidase
MSTRFSNPRVPARAPRPPRPNEPILKTAEELAVMRQAGRIVALAHAAMREMLRPGISTLDLDRVAEQVIRDHGAIPSFKGYPKPGAPDYPGTINASINHELVHGLPRADRVLREGDLISLDCGATYQGFVGDSAYSYAVGRVSSAVERLLRVTEEALHVGIRAAVVGNETADVSAAVQAHISKNGYGIVREYTGHGVGRDMHEPPEVPNWWPRNAARIGWKSYPLVPGMTFALEPMVTAGRPETRELADGWTVVSADGSLCAHFEHTIAVTEDGPLILTLP